MHQDDERIKKDLVDQLYWDDRIDASRVTVEAANGVVDLQGTVDTFFERATAEDVASRVEGVVVVDNDIAVRDPQTAYYDAYVDRWSVHDYAWYTPDRGPSVVRDVEIQEQINDELLWCPFVDADQVTVVVEERRATLNGTVDSWGEYRAATENAYQGGAIWVDNELFVSMVE